MKVIWQNNKALQIESQNVGCGPNISSRHVLAKSKGPHPLPQEPYKEDHRRRTVKTQSSAERSQECHPESGDVFKQLLGSQSAESWNPSCRVCGRAGELQDLENCDQLLQNVFGVMVQCASAKVCNDCAELMQHTQRFKNMVCAAFQHSSETSTLKNEPSVHSIANKKGSDLKERGDTYITAKTSKRKTKLLTAEPANKKIIAACTVCSQKYAMPRTSGDFVCSRCKLTNSNEKTITCVKCRSKVPSTLIKDHLEIHAQANLKGRFRLRSLTQKPSSVETTDRVPRKYNQLQTRSMKKLQPLNTSEGEFCHICGKYVVSANYLQKHLKTHAVVKTFECRYCGRIFKGVAALQTHTTLRHVDQLINK